MGREEAVGVLRKFTVEKIPTKFRAQLVIIAEYALEKAIEWSPFKTGAFMASWRISIDGLATPEEAHRGVSFGGPEDAAETARSATPVQELNNLPIGSSFYIMNNIKYATYVEYGSPTTEARYITRRVAQAIGGRFGSIRL